MTKETIATLQKLADERGIELTVATTEPGKTPDIVRSLVESADVIIAAGGDGTVSDVVTGSVDHDVLIGVVPRGSTNMLAKELGIPSDIAAAAAVALGDGQVESIDVARVNSTTCIHIAGAGFDAEIFRLTDQSMKQRIRWLAYLPAALRSLKFPMFQAEIVIDGERRIVPARLVLCALGGSIIHPAFQLGEHVDRTDGVIDVIVWNPPNVLAVLSCAAWIAIRRPGRSRWMFQTGGKHIAVSADQSVPLQVDGDVIGELPATIDLLDRQASLLVPRT